MTLHLNHLVQVWSAEEGGQLLYDPESQYDSLTWQDEYGLNNWANLPNEVWLQAVTPAYLAPISAQFEGRFHEHNPDMHYPSATRTVTVNLNCVQLDLQLANTPESQEEDPGVYINVNWDDDDEDGWTNSGAPPDATYTPDRDDDEVDSSQEGKVVGDDDLRECVLSLNGIVDGGSVTLTFPNNIRCWGSRPGERKVSCGRSSGTHLKSTPGTRECFSRSGDEKHLMLGRPAGAR